MKKLFIVALVSGAGLAIQVPAETLAAYRFSDKISAVLPDEKALGISGRFGIGPGVKKGALSVSAIAFSKPGSLYLQDRSFDENNEAGAKKGDDYICCTITPQSGKRMSFSNLTFHTLRRDLNNEGIGAPDRFSVYTSADNFTAPIGTGEIGLKPGDERQFSRHSIDLLNIPALQSVNAEIHFKIYFWVSQEAGSGEGGRIFRVDDLSVSGTVK